MPSVFSVQTVSKKTRKTMCLAKKKIDAFRKNKNKNNKVLPNCLIKFALISLLHAEYFRCLYMCMSNCLKQVTSANYEIFYFYINFKFCFDITFLAISVFVSASCQQKKWKLKVKFEYISTIITTDTNRWLLYF